MKRNRKIVKTKRRYRWDAILSRLKKGIELIGAEIGIWDGKTSWRILKARPLLKLIMIDPWTVPDPGSTYEKTADENASKPAIEHRRSYNRTVRAVAFARSRAIIKRNMSHEIAPTITDKTLDFVFIDGDHSYEGTSLDIKLWLPKIKKGGWIGGHDYNHYRPELFGVTIAVNEAFEKSQIQLDDNRTWFVEVK